MTTYFDKRIDSLKALASSRGLRALCSETRAPPGYFDSFGWFHSKAPAPLLQAALTQVSFYALPSTIDFKGIFLPDLHPLYWDGVQVRQINPEKDIPHFPGINNTGYRIDINRQNIWIALGNLEEVRLKFPPESATTNDLAVALYYDAPLEIVEYLVSNNLKCMSINADMLVAGLYHGSVKGDARILDYLDSIITFPKFYAPPGKRRDYPVLNYATTPATLALALRQGASWEPVDIVAYYTQPGGSLALFQGALDRHPAVRFKFTSNALTELLFKACRTDDMEMLKWLDEFHAKELANFPFLKLFGELYGGDRASLPYNRLYYKFSSRVMYWIDSHVTDPTKSVGWNQMYQLAGTCDIDLVKHYMGRGYPPAKYLALEPIILSGNVDFLKWVIEEYNPPHKSFTNIYFSMAIKSLNMEMVEYVRTMWSEEGLMHDTVSIVALYPYNIVTMKFAEQIAKEFITPTFVCVYCSTGFLSRAMYTWILYNAEEFPYLREVIKKIIGPEDALQQQVMKLL